MAANAFNRMCMVSVTHDVDDRMELVMALHRLFRLSVRREESPKGGFLAHCNSESSLVVEVKSKKQLDPLLMELKEPILRKSN